ncbi:MAG TPA: nicotinate-nucleotide adenylyltransferase [Syntrophomonadaceae bacterium]|nr:nicotinate-nucleotide adenylyltransferase [Syntrophomonadaceae bacterium]
MTHRKAIGILGGTFDPVHYGHLVAAQYAAYGFHLNRVIFMPAAQPPHKNAVNVLEARHRLAMIQLAIADNPVFEMSTLEIERSGISYTVDTVETMLRTYPDMDLYFIMGMDSLYILDTWKDVQRLVAMCRFIVVTRPNYCLNRSEPALQAVPEQFWDRADFLEIPAMDISSTDLRARVRQGKPIRYLVPPAVEKYIYDHALYQGD